MFYFYLKKLKVKYLYISIGDKVTTLQWYVHLSRENISYVKYAKP